MYVIMQTRRLFCSTVGQQAPSLFHPMESKKQLNLTLGIAASPKQNTYGPEISDSILDIMTSDKGLGDLK